MANDAQQRLALVDCGTNTFTLQIANLESGRWESVFRQRRFVRIGLNSFRTGKISPDRMRRGLDVLTSFKETACNYNVTHVRAVGCSALRDARNGSDFVRLANEVAWPVEVIDGKQEANWIHLGVADTVSEDHMGDGPVLTMDIGGGSVELILWNHFGVVKAWSLDLGVARLTDWIKPSDPLSPSDLLSMKRVVGQTLEPVLLHCKGNPPTMLVGTSGAFNTLSVMENPMAQWHPRSEADVLPLGSLRSRCKAVAGMTKVELSATENVHPDRVPYMSVACALIEEVMEAFPSIHRVLRSRHTLAEGVFVEAAQSPNGLPKGWRPLQV